MQNPDGSRNVSGRRAPGAPRGPLQAAIEQCAKDLIALDNEPLADKVRNWPQVRQRRYEQRILDLAIAILHRKVFSTELQQKDTFEFQAKRLHELFRTRAPGKEIRFRNRAGLLCLHVRDVATDTFLIDSGEWLPVTLADKSDDELWIWLQYLSGGKL
jgi:hypothetical protein